MKLQPCSIISFQRRLKTSEETEYKSVLNEAKQKVGNKGHSVIIMPSSSLPHYLSNNVGCGNMLNKESREFFDFAKLYWGINYVQLLPEGQFARRVTDYKPYSGSSLDLGDQLINLDILTTNEYGRLLDKKDIENIVKLNLKTDKDVHINYEHTLSEGSATDKALHKAFNELYKADSSEKTAVLKEIEKYKSENHEWLNRKSVYHALSLKNGISDPNLWNDMEKNLFNSDKINESHREQIINSLKENPEYKKEMDFYVFKQFLADKHLARAKKELNDKGIKLSGDMIAGCSYDETWMFPKAFHHNHSSFWGLNAINYDTSEGKEFLRLKVKNFAKRYDGIRVDASWLYAKQFLENKSDKRVDFKEYNSEILDIIDSEIKKIKGQNYNLNNIMHEFEADPAIFSVYSESGLRPEVANRTKIFKTDYLSKDWDSVNAFRERGWGGDTYIIGTTNHDTLSLRDLYKKENLRKSQSEELARILKLPSEKIQTLSQFMQAKFAEPIRGFHNMFFFSDALNLEEGFHVEGKNDTYRLKVPHNYQEKYFQSLEKGEGLNMMDALQKAFVAEGLDKTEPELYKKIKKYNKILQSREKTFAGNKILMIIASSVIAVTALTLAIIKKSNERHGRSVNGY